MANGEWMVASQTKAKDQAKGELSSPTRSRKKIDVLGI